MTGACAVNRHPGLTLTDDRLHLYQTYSALHERWEEKALQSVRRLPLKHSALTRHAATQGDLQMRNGAHLGQEPRLGLEDQAGLC